MKSLVITNQISEALFVIKNMQDSAFQATALCDLALSASYQNHPETPALIATAIGSLENSPSPEQSPWLVENIARALLLQGRANEALQLRSHLKKKARRSPVG
jgi:hypothetical protein